jgi:hypothetical protein
MVQTTHNNKLFRLSDHFIDMDVAQEVIFHGIAMCG